MNAVLSNDESDCIVSRASFAPLRGGSARPGRRPSTSRDRPILLLQGFGCSNQVMLPLGRRLRSALGRHTARLDRSTHTFEDIRRSAREKLRDSSAVLSRLSVTPAPEASLR